MTPQAIVLMGVAGAGKTTIGRLLSAKLGWPFYDGDDFMPEANVAKMAAGQPLTDEDRRPWLAILNQLMREYLADGRSLIIGSSALKKTYRQQLSQGVEPISFVYLKGDYQLIAQRIEERQGHFMKVGMLSSQFETLEEPQNAIIIEAALPPAAIIERIMMSLE